MDLAVGDVGLELRQRRRRVGAVEPADGHHRCTGGQLVARRVVRTHDRGGPRVIVGVGGQQSPSARAPGSGRSSRPPGPDLPKPPDRAPARPTGSRRCAGLPPWRRSTRSARPGTPRRRGRRPVVRPRRGSRADHQQQCRRRRLPPTATTAPQPRQPVVGAGQQHTRPGPTVTSDGARHRGGGPDVGSVAPQQSCTDPDAARRSAGASATV